MINHIKKMSGGASLLSQALKLLTLTTLLIFTGCGGGGSSTQVPVFSSSATASVAENQTSAIRLVASNTTSYAISGTDSASFNLNTITGVVTFKVAPDFENPTDDGTDNTYKFTATATGAGGSVKQSVAVTVTDVNEISTTELYIKSAIYDNNQTKSVADDKLYLYYNKAIDPNSIANVGSNYEIEGNGVIGGGTSDYNDTIFHRYSVTLSSGTEFSTGDDNISLKPNTITAANGDFPTDYNKTTVKNFNILGRLQTGQTTSYATNDDGDLQRGVARSYTDNGDGTVTDNATGLMWQKEDDNTQRTWADAISYCGNLDLPVGTTDWRLPSIEELESIEDLGRTDPAINPIFTSTNSSNYWSSTTDASDTSYAWDVYFGDGYDLWGDKTYAGFVRCVRPSDN